MRLDLAYDGTEFSGWAVQPQRRTVAGVLTQALARHPPNVGEPVRLVVAGRTDAGVHARGQVAHLDVTPADVTPGEVAHLECDASTEPSPGVRWVHRVNRALPADVRLLRALPAPAGFDARFSALWRRYVYRIADPCTRADPVRRREVLDHPRPLDIDPMNAAAQLLLGLRDFAAFCKRREGATTIRTLYDLRAARDASGRIAVTVRADAFCQSMVRSLVGALIAVGERRRPAGWPADLLAAKVRAPEVTVAAARGLTLEEVAYPPDDQLAARAEQTRTVRTT